MKAFLEVTISALAADCNGDSTGSVPGTAHQIVQSQNPPEF